MHSDLIGEENNIHSFVHASQVELPEMYKFFSSWRKI
jgi:hypothetical protein